MGGTSLMDLVLCAVGCMLLLFIIQIAAPRAPGRDTRPFVVTTCGFVPDPTRRGAAGFRWELVGPDGVPVSPGLPEGAAVQPRGAATRGPDQRALFLIPEAATGTWTLRVVVDYPEADLDPVFREPLLRPPQRDNPAWESYFAALRAYRAPTAAAPELAGYDQFEKLLAAVDPDGIANESKAVKVNPRHDRAFEKYVGYRLLSLRAGYLGRVARAGDVPAADRDVARTKLRAVNDEIATFVERVKPEAGNRGEFWSLWLGLRADEECRTARERSDRADDAHVPLVERAGWDALDAELKQLELPLGVGGQDYTSSREYVLARTDWIRWRGAFEYAAGPGYDAARKVWEGPLLREALDFGRPDALLQFVAREFQVVLARDNRVRVDVGVGWGDAGWPARSGGGRVTPFTGVIALQPGDTGRALNLLEIVLDRGRDGPEVHPAPILLPFRDHP